jgi:malate dehydrogenase (quinone)
VTELLATPAKKLRALRQFAPRAKRADWHLITAGQRVQIMKRDARGKAVIQFGTEVVASADGTIAGLLGASPGASTAVPIMLDLLAKCFPDRLARWEPRLEEMIPSYGSQLSGNKTAAKSILTRTAKALAIAP